MAFRAALPDASDMPETVRIATAVPSGQSVDLFEVLLDQVEAEVWARFRFLAPDIGKTGADLAFEQVIADFEFLCNEVALPYLAEYALAPQVISIALLDRVVEFGTSDPEATQYIELFRVEGSVCAPEGPW